MSLPAWLESLCRTCVIETVNGDARTRGDYLLGVHRTRVFREVIGGGQANFDAEWSDPMDPTVRLVGTDRARLYAFFNMKGHLVELIAAFRMLFAEFERLEPPVVLDLGCGPGTGCLAIADAIGQRHPFDYIGVDRAEAMLLLGRELTSAAQPHGYLDGGQCTFVRDLDEVEWQHAPGWRPVIVIVSYLFASPTLDADALAQQALHIIDRVGRGPALVLYTNSVQSFANSQFPTFRDALLSARFKLHCAEDGQVTDGGRERQLYYALFVRQRQKTLQLGGGR